jgi:hypothetical protein
MAKLNTDPGFAAADADMFYANLVDAHRNLDETASAKFNAKLVLLLANHIGDLEALNEALAAAQERRIPR